MVDKRVIDTIIAEAVNGGDPGMLAVAYTILNRMAKSGDSALDIVSAPSQFEGYSNPGPGVQSSINDPAVRARVERLWEQAKNRAVPDPTQGGTMFHASSITPYWADEANRHGTIKIAGQTYYLGGKKPEPVSPDVPPRRPDGETAVAAIEALLGTSDPTATAYAPASGSLEAKPVETIQSSPVSARLLRALEPSVKATDVPATIAAALRPGVATPGRVETATSPSIDTIQAQDLNPDLLSPPTGGFTRGRRPATDYPRKLNGDIDLARVVYDYAQDYVPPKARVAQTNVTSEGLTVRPVTTVPVNPDGSVGPPNPAAAFKDDLQAALTRVSQRRAGSAPTSRRELSLAAAATSDPVDGKSVLDRQNPFNQQWVYGKQYENQSAGRWAFPANDGLSSLVPRDEPAQSALGSAFMADVANRSRYRAPSASLEAAAVDYAGSPVFGDNPDMKRLVAEPTLVTDGLPPAVAPGSPGALRLGALNAPLGAVTEPGMPSWLRAKPSAQPPIELAGVTIDPKTNMLVFKNPIQPSAAPQQPDPSPLIPTAGTGAVIDMLQSPGAQMLGQVNMGQRPIIGALMRLFGGFGKPNGVKPNVLNSLVGTSTSLKPSVSDYVATSPGMPRPDGLSPSMAAIMGYVDPRTL